MNAIACLFLFTTVLSGVHGLDLNRRNKTELFRRIISAECAEFGEVAHGTVSKINSTNVQGIHIECDEGYDLTGGPKVLCNDGRWDAAPRPMCAKRCKPPPLLRDGGVRIEGRQDGPDSYRHGTKAVYSCSEGFQLSPPASHVRACHDGVWTGLAATCVSNGCPPPPPVADGYHVLEPLSAAAAPSVGRAEVAGGAAVAAGVGQRAHYGCHVGFALQGPASLQCLASGQWNPRQPPKCVRQYGPPTEPPPPPPLLPAVDADADNDGIAAHVPHELPLPVCPPAPTLHHTQVSVLDGPQTANNAGAGARLEVRCRDGYRDPAAPCVPAVLYCQRGSWVGQLPVCEPVSDCPPPPSVQHGSLSPPPPRDSSYPVGAAVSYSCAPGYLLEGERTLTCAPTGCWEPATLPACRSEHQLFELAGCPPPPLVEHSTMSSPTSETSYPVGSSVSYSCFQGFLMHGDSVVSCSPAGTWQPAALPSCLPDPQQPYAYLSTSSVLLVSLAVALGVSLILLVICVVVVCRHQGPKARSGVASPSSSAGGGGHRGGPPGALGGPRHVSPAGCVASSAGVLHDPDRVALIAFADGVQLGESTALPTYEEAVRGCDRGAGGLGGGPPSCARHTPVLQHIPHGVAEERLGGRRLDGLDGHDDAERGVDDGDAGHGVVAHVQQRAERQRRGGELPGHLRKPRLLRHQLRTQHRRRPAPGGERAGGGGRGRAVQAPPAVAGPAGRRLMQGPRGALLAPPAAPLPPAGAAAAAPAPAAQAVRPGADSAATARTSARLQTGCGTRKCAIASPNSYSSAAKKSHMSLWN